MAMLRHFLPVVIVSILTSTSLGQQAIPNLSGTWELDPARTTAPHQPSNAVIKIEQTGPQIRYEYFANGVLKYGGTLITDGKERERYKTKVDRVYYRARWIKGDELVIVTRGFQDAMGTLSLATRTAGRHRAMGMFSLTPCLTRRSPSTDGTARGRSNMTSQNEARPRVT